MTSATSLVLIAAGAILAFAVSYEVAGISIKTVGIILMAVGGIGLAFAMATLAGYAPWGANRAVAAVQPPASVAIANNAAPPAPVAPAASTTPPANV